MVDKDGRCMMYLLFYLLGYLYNGSRCQYFKKNKKNMLVCSDRNPNFDSGSGPSDPNLFVVKCMALLKSVPEQIGRSRLNLKIWVTLGSEFLKYSLSRSNLNSQQRTLGTELTGQSRKLTHSLISHFNIGYATYLIG